MMTWEKSLSKLIDEGFNWEEIQWLSVFAVHSVIHKEIPHEHNGVTNIIVEELRISTFALGKPWPKNNSNEKST
jgi:hypothetical protein